MKVEKIEKSLAYKKSKKKCQGTHKKTEKLMIKFTSD